MQIRRISIYDEFKCSGSDCPENCCSGCWSVPIDPAMYAKYRAEKSIRGLLLNCLTVKKKGRAAFRNTFRGCPFWGRDRLCTLQKKYGTALLPSVCILFPRQLSHLGYFCEETLYLACPETARLFLQSAQGDRPFDFTVTEGAVDYPVNTTNDDREFLDYLVKSREALIGMLRDGLPFQSMAILEYGRRAQNACLDGTPLPGPTDFSSEGQFQLSCSAIDTLLFHGFYHPALRLRSPLLYQLCRKYIRLFGTRNRRHPGTAERKLACLKKNLALKLPDFDRVLNRYFEYYLLTNFLDIYEDYSFSKHLLFGVVKAEMLRLFTALYAEDKTNISTPETARILAVYERRAPQMKDALKLL